MKIAAICIIVISGVFYQICSKAIPEGVNPFVPLLCTYAVAFLTALVLCICTGNIANIGEDLKKVNSFSLLLGAVICFYELGFILAYRNGFSFTTLPPLANILVIIAVCGVGVLIYREHMSLINLGGILLSVLGISLTMIK